MPRSPPDRLSIEVALKNREFEIQLFWQRSNYFLVLITALGAGVIASRDSLIGLLICFFGVCAAALWFRTNLGSRYWQTFWEAEVERIAPNHKLKSFQLSHDEIDAMVAAATRSTTGKPLRAWVDKEVLKKPSVTYHMILLSLVALFFWVSMFAYYAVLNARVVIEFLNAKPAVPVSGQLVQPPPMESKPVLQPQNQPGAESPKSDLNSHEDPGITANPEPSLAPQPTPSPVP